MWLRVFLCLKKKGGFKKDQMNRACLQQVKELYGLECVEAKRVEKGFLSENHELVCADGTKYFLKKYRFDDEGRIQDIHISKKFFYDGNIPVIFPISTKLGQTYFCFDGAYYAVFPFVVGKQIARGKMSEKAIVSLGTMLGRIHLLGKGATLSIKIKTKEWKSSDILKTIDIIEGKIQEKSLLEDFDTLALESMNLKKELIKKYQPTDEEIHLPKDHLIHGDYLDQNVFFGENDEVSHVFDFEKTEYAPRMYEFFRSMMFSFLSGEIGPAHIEQAKTYTNAYSQVYPIPTEEFRRGLRFFLSKHIHSLWVESEHYLQGNDRPDIFLKEDYLRLKYLADHYDDVEKWI